MEILNKINPPKSSRYLDCKKDYDNFEFHSNNMEYSRKFKRQF